MTCAEKQACLVPGLQGTRGQTLRVPNSLWAFGLLCLSSVGGALWKDMGWLEPQEAGGDVRGEDMGLGGWRDLVAFSAFLLKTLCGLTLQSAL